MLRLKAVTGAAVAALQRTELLWLFLLAIAPAIVLCGWIDRYGVNVPLGDEWALVPMFEKWSSGQLAIGDLYQQHNEHRIVIPKLIYLAFAHLTGWNLRGEMFFSLALWVATSAGIYVLLRRTLGGSPRGVMLLWAAANLLLFSPAQAQNWIWGFQLQMFIPTVCLVSTLVILTSEWQWWPKFVASAFLIAVATFSFGSGLLLWLVVALCLALRGESKWRVGLWLLVFAVVLGLYFAGYSRLARPSPVTGKWNEYAGYFFTFIGGAVAHGAEGQLLLGPMFTGAVAVALFAALCVYLWKSGGDALRNAAPWLVLGPYVIGSAALTALSRVNWGARQAMDSRYVTSSNLLYLALLVLVTIVARRAEDAGSRRAGALAAARTAVVTAIVVLTLAAYPTGLEDMATLHREQVAGLGALEFSKVIDTTDAMRRDLRMVPGFVPAPLQAVEALERMHLLQYRRRESALLEEGQHGVTSKRTRFGRIDEFKESGAGNFEISGWAVLPGSRRPAPLVVLGYRQGERWTAFAVSDVWEWRDDVVAKLRSRAYHASGWRKTFNRQGVPAEAEAISAWAVDPLANKAHKLSGEHPLPKL